MSFRKNASRTAVERAFCCDECGLVAMAEVRSSSNDELDQEVDEDIDPFAIAAALDLKNNSLDVIGLSECPRCGQRSRVAVGLLKAGTWFFAPFTITSLLAAWFLAPSFFMVLALFASGLGITKLTHYARLWRAQRHVIFRDSKQTLAVSRPLPQARARLQPAPAQALPEPIPVGPRPTHEGRAPTANDAEPSILK